MTVARRWVAMTSVAGALALLVSADASIEPRRPPRPIPEGAQTVTAETHNLNAQFPMLDGQWQGVKVASDGKVYFTSSCHAGNHGAAFFCYDPREKELRTICADLTVVCGEGPLVNPQGKMHSDITEANGWLYFATHFSSERPGAEETYTGSHALGYELATGKFRDFGVIHPNYTCYSGISVDPHGRYLYAYVTPVRRADREAACRLYRYDLPDGRKTDLGPLFTGRIAGTFYLFVDSKGDCWFQSLRVPGTLFCARAETGKIDKWEQVTRDSWHWLQRLPGQDAAVFTTLSGKTLMRFDPSQAPNWEKVFTPLAETGFIGLGATLAKDRVFFIQSAGGRSIVKADDLHLKSVAVTPDAKVIDHGLIVDAAGRRPWRLEAMAADAQGRVFIVGDWYTLPGEPGMRRYHFDNGDSYEEQIRRQVFAVVDVSKDLPAPLAGK